MGTCCTHLVENFDVARAIQIGVGGAITIGNFLSALRCGISAEESRNITGAAKKEELTNTIMLLIKETNDSTISQWIESAGGKHFIEDAIDVMCAIGNSGKKYKVA